MDEVFGNSSSETVVSVTEVKKLSQTDIRSEEGQIPSKSEKEKDRPDSKKGAQIYFLPKVINSSNWDSENLPSEVQTRELEIQCNRPSVITCAPSILKGVDNDNQASVYSHSNKEEEQFKLPTAPPGLTPFPLRHIHSAVVSRIVAEPPTRPRSHSVATSQMPPKYHPYQNLPNFSTERGFNSPQYINLPRRERRVTKSTKTPPTSPWKGSVINSAPSTPRGTHDISSPRLVPTHSYIQLWTGAKDDQQSSGSSISSISANGYVEMSSPYVRSPNSSVLSDLASRLAAYAGKAPKSIFCPFCPRHFTHESNLGNHIRTNHNNELQNAANETEVTVQYCPVCQSRFFNLDLLPNHLLEFHRGSVIELLTNYHCLTPNEESGLKCPFCVKRVPKGRVGEDVLLYHVLHFHPTDYSGLINSIFKPVSEKTKPDLSRKSSSESLTSGLAFKPGVTSTPGLSMRFQTLTCETNSSASCVKVDETWTSHCHVKSSPNKVTSHSDQQDEDLDLQLNKGILRSQTDISRKPNVKRELRFSVPHVTSEEVFVPLTPEHSPEAPTQPVVDNRRIKLEEFVKTRHNLPVRVDSLSSADFIEMTQQCAAPVSKKRKLGIGLKSKKAFKKKDKENFDPFKNEKSKSTSKLSSQRVVATSSTRVFRKPLPVDPPRVPENAFSTGKGKIVQHRVTQMSESDVLSQLEGTEEPSPFSNMKLYSPLRIFRCNNCRIKFCDNDSLSCHISMRHRSLLGFFKPNFGCGICSAKFFENKYLVKHCLQHHTSLLEIRSPNRHKIAIYKSSKV